MSLATSSSVHLEWACPRHRAGLNVFTNPLLSLYTDERLLSAAFNFPATLDIPQIDSVFLSSSTHLLGGKEVDCEMTKTRRKVSAYVPV